MCPQTWQSTDETVREYIGSVAGEELDNILTLLDDKFKVPLGVSLSGSVLTVLSSKLTKLESDGSDSTQESYKWRIPTLANLDIETQESTLDLSDGDTTGDFFEDPVVSPSVSGGYFIQMGLEVRTDGYLHAVWGESASSVSGTTPPPFASGSLQVCISVLENDGTPGQWNFNTPAKNDVEIITKGSSGSGAGNADSVWQTMLDEMSTLPYEFLTGNIFSLDGDNKVDSSSTGSYDLANTTYNLESSQIFITENMLSSEFLDAEIDIVSARIKVVYDTSYIDANPNIDISRDGGNEYQDLDELERIGTTDTWIGKHLFDTEAANQTLIEKPVTDATTTQELTASSNNQSFSQFFVDTVSEMVKGLTVYVNKTGAPVGQLTVKLVKDSSGEPSSDIDDILAEKYIDIADLGTGNQTISLTFDAVLIANSKYHIVFETNATYKSSYVASTTSLAVRTDNSTASDIMKQFNGSVWADLASNQIVYKVEGRELDLKLKITASEASRIRGVGIYYGEEPNASTGSLKTQVFAVETTAGVKTLTLTEFTPDKNLLEVIVPSRGQIFRQDPSTFTIEGNDLVFVEDFFKDLPAETISVIVDQNRSTVIDGSDDNRAILNENHLGSQNSSRDSSLSGRGILLRNSDGTLVEVWVDADNNIQISEVI